MKLPNILKEIGEVADKEGINAFVVGGFVRDLLLGVDDKDIDIVVEANAIDFAEKFNVGAYCNTPLHATHGGFKTATIDIGGYKIDFVTARKEHYKKPAALPQIEPATIREDLFRRDFTVNSIAISLNKNSFAEIVDFYNGQKDLKDKKIRVMHDKSFIDDPTRIFRAIKFKHRLGFDVEPYTQKLIKEAVAIGMIAKLKNQRIKKEIDLILKEPNALKIISELRGYGIGEM